MVAGFFLGGGIDLGMQLYQNGGQWSAVNWTQVGVSAAAGLLGIGLGAAVPKLTANVVGRVVLNGVGSAAIGWGAAVTQNRFQGNRFSPVSVGQTALIGGALGAAGSLVGEAAEGAVRAFSNWRFEQSWNRATLGQRLSATSNAWVDYGRRYTPASAYVVGFGNAVGVTMANSGPFVGPFGAWFDDWWPYD